MDQGRQTIVIVDDSSIYKGKKDIAKGGGVDAIKHYPMNFKVLTRYIEDRINAEPAQLIYYGFAQRNGRATRFHDKLVKDGYKVNTMSASQPFQVSKQVLSKLKEIEHQEYDLFFVGGNFYFRNTRDQEDSRSIGEVLLDISKSRKVSVAYFDPQAMQEDRQDLVEVLNNPRIEFHDLVTNVGAVSNRLYKVTQSTQSAVESVNIDQVATESKNTDIVVLIDGENIDGVLRDILQNVHGESYLLKPDDRPHWDRVIEWMYKKYSRNKKLHILFFVQYKPTTRGFVATMKEQHPLIRFVEIKPEPGSDIDNPHKNRSVVDDCINTTIQQLVGTWRPDSGLQQTRWGGDLYVLTHDNDFIDSMQELNNVRSGIGNVGVVGFNEKMNGDYWMNTSIMKIDIEHDMKAFSYELPARPKIVSADSYDPAEFLPTIIAKIGS